MQLTDKEVRVLVRIDRELLPIDCFKLPEFPKITEEDVKKSVKKLMSLKLIRKDNEGLWHTSDSGDDYLSTVDHSIIKEFYDGIAKDWNNKKPK